MRLLSLCSLAAEHDAIPYDTIVGTLQIEKGEVEHWVVKAVISKLLDARLDQLRETVLVHRSALRMFSQGKWSDLQGKLNAWKANVRSLLQSVQAARSKRDGVLRRD